VFIEFAPAIEGSPSDPIIPHMSFSTNPKRTYVLVHEREAGMRDFGEVFLSIGCAWRRGAAGADLAAVACAFCVNLLEDARGAGASRTWRSGMLRRSWRMVWRPSDRIAGGRVCPFPRCDKPGALYHRIPKVVRMKDANSGVRGRGDGETRRYGDGETRGRVGRWMGWQCRRAIGR
jgi:hypothetical protein